MPLLSYVGVRLAVVVFCLLVCFQLSSYFAVLAEGHFFLKNPLRMHFAYKPHIKDCIGN